jgi:tetratricopeptide (TPR) repeat protein
VTFNRRIAVALCLALAAAALFPTLRNGFTTWDDPKYILGNPLVQGLSPGSVVAMFTTPQYEGNYHPVTLLVIALEHSLFSSSPFGYHLVSLLLHLLATYLVYRFLLALTKTEALAFGAALLFGVHPLHVEPVAWLSDQKDLLYTVFYLGAAVSYVRYRDSGESRHLYRAVLPLFLLSLLSKGLAVTLPVALLLIDAYRERALTAGGLRKLLPFFALSVVFGVLAINAQASAGAITVAGVDTPVEKLLCASKGYVLYIVKLVAPFGLSPWYPYPLSVPASYWIYPPLAAAVVAAAIARRRKYPVVFFGVAWYSVTVAPVLQLLQVGNAEMADRYAYLPSVGILLILVWAFVTVTARFGAGTTARSLPRIAAGAYVLLLAGISVPAGGVWRDGTTLWGRVVERFPDSPKGWFNRGAAYHEAGAYRLAVADYDRAIALNPKYPYAWSNRGLSVFFLGDRERALADITRELGERPDDPEVRFLRGNVLATLSRFGEAAADFTVVLKDKPGDFDATVQRGLVYTSARDYPKAEADFDHAIALRPSDPNLYFNRANVRAGMKRWDDAIADYSAVLRLTPADREALYARGITSYLKGDTAGACEDLRRASTLGSARADTAIAQICPR